MQECLVKSTAAQLIDRLGDKKKNADLRNVTGALNYTLALQRPPLD